MDTNISSIGSLITTALIIYWGICYFMGKFGLHKNPMIISDNYQLGYFKDYRPQKPSVKVVIKKVAASKEMAAPKKTVKTQQKPKVMPKVVQQPKPAPAPAPAPAPTPVAKPSFYDECIQSLVAIGHKPSVAKKLTDGFFNKDTASTLEEFFVKINKR
jgi:hypothetical protein